MRVGALLVPLLLGLPLLAGCFGADPLPEARRFQASGGVSSAGYAYDGAGVEPASATLTGEVNDATNTGSVEVAFDHAGARWVATFDRFVQAEGRTFQDGGVEFEIPEHGETGIGDAAIPRIHAAVAAWGQARLTRDGALVTEEPWTAHLMLSADTVRGPDGKITKADGATPYDSATPTDARRVEGDPQAIFFVKHPQGETFSRGETGVGANLSCAGPQCAQVAEIPLERGAGSLVLDLVFTPGGSVPVAVGRARVGITDANGTEVMPTTEVTLAPGPTPTAQHVEVADASALVGPLLVSLSGEGAFTMQVTGSVTYADFPFLLVTWDEYALEDVSA